MARTKQTDPEKTVEVMDESNIESETTTEITPEQACRHLQMLYGLSRSKKVRMTCIKIAIKSKHRFIDLAAVIDKVKSKQLKRAGDEEFKLPKKAARTIKEIPIEKVVCTTGNKFSVLEEEEAPGQSSSPLTVKPIMLKISRATT
ncbi:hypothetical protein TNCV_769921 [Trichonephila clavipes]|nr:hypothetical protein TNCV_769921 [Trichonephila clavipes]